MDEECRQPDHVETSLRKIVFEEVRKALKDVFGAKLEEIKTANNSIVSTASGPCSSAPPLTMKTENYSNMGTFEIQFCNSLMLPLFTGSRVQAEYNEPLRLVIVNKSTGDIVRHGPLSSLPLKLLVLEGDFQDKVKAKNNPHKKRHSLSWTAEDFSSSIIQDRQGRAKRPLLTGNLDILLQSGEGECGHIQFEDNSSWVRSRKFCLAAHVDWQACGQLANGHPIIREAVTEGFSVRDNRGQLHKKHYPPMPDDEVWRLEGIGKDGAFCQRLASHGIHSVQQLVQYLALDPRCLRRLIGSGLSSKTWDALVDHAQSTVLDGQFSVYIPTTTTGLEPCGAVFNSIFQCVGLIFGSRFIPIDELPPQSQAMAATMINSAYEDWDHCVPLSGEHLEGDTSLSTAATPLPFCGQLQVARGSAKALLLRLHNGTSAERAVKAGSQSRKRGVVMASDVSSSHEDSISSKRQHREVEASHPADGGGYTQPSAKRGVVPATVLPHLQIHQAGSYDWLGGQSAAKCVLQPAMANTELNKSQQQQETNPWQGTGWDFFATLCSPISSSPLPPLLSPSQAIFPCWPPPAMDATSPLLNSRLPELPFFKDGSENNPNNEMQPRK